MIKALGCLVAASLVGCSNMNVHQAALMDSATTYYRIDSGETTVDSNDAAQVAATTYAAKMGIVYGARLFGGNVCKSVYKLTTGVALGSAAHNVATSNNQHSDAANVAGAGAGMFAFNKSRNYANSFCSK